MKNILFNLFLLFLIFIPLLTFASFQIDYQGEHNNYGDNAKIRQHIKNHLKDIPFEDISDDDDLYYLFSIHDANNDGFLDGHELREAFTDNIIGNKDEQPPLKLEEIIEMIDHVLLEDDMDNDGKISWEEYLLSQTYHQVS